MNDVLSLTTVDAEKPVAVTQPGSRSVYEWLVVRVLRKFRHGGLRMVWPNGESEVFGEKHEPVTAEIRILRGGDFFRRCALYGNVGLGESYMDGDWETDSISAVISWFVENVNRTPELGGSSQRLPLVSMLRFFNRLRHRWRANTVKTSRRNIAEHYDLGNAFYALWLDKTMTYSAARFSESSQSLEEAQFAKYEALCQRLKLQPSDHVLEIGCGWGGFSVHAAKHHGCRVTAITISQEQFDYATERVRREGLSDRVEIRLQDYRHVTGQFDKIASIEMLEAVGDQYLETYFRKCAEVLKRDGLLALQMITVPDHAHKQLRKGADWIQKHIFPGSLLLSITRVNSVVSRTGRMFLHELEDLGSSYARTLHLWWEQFNARLPDVRSLGFDETFIRKWNYYLQYCEAAFAMRHISVVQVCYTRANNATLKTDLGA